MRGTIVVVAWVLLCLPLPAQEKEPPAKGRIRLVIENGGPTSPLIQMAFRKNGQELVTVSGDQSIRFWDADSGALRQVLRPSVASLEAAGFSPDGRFLAVGVSVKEGPRVLIVDLDQAKVVRTLTPLAGPRNFYALAFAPDGRYLAAGRLGAVQLWDLKTGKHHTYFVGANFVSVAFAPDGKRLAAGVGINGFGLHVLSVPQLDLEANLPAGLVNCLAWTKDALLVGNNSGVHVWDDDKKQVRDKSQLAPVNALATNPTDGKSLLMVGGDDKKGFSRVNILDAATGKILKNLAASKVYPAPVACAFTPDGKRAAASFGPDHGLWIYSVTGAAAPVHIAGQGSITEKVALSKDGATVTWEQAGKTRSFNLATLDFAAKPAVVGLTSGNSNRLDFQDMRVSLNGPGFAIAKKGATAATYHFIAGHTGDVTCLAVSVDERYILTGSFDQTVRIWRPDRLRPLLSLFVSGNEWIVWTPEGYYAASPGGERLMGWEVHHDPETLADFFPAQQFRKALYRPEVISKIMEGGTLAAAFKLTATKPSPAGPDLAKLLPPQVRIDGPAQVKATSPKFQVTASAEAKDQQILDLVLLRNERPWQTPQKFVPGKPATWDLTLEPGPQRLKVVARGSASTGFSKEVEVIYTPALEVKKAGPRLFVLAVGINDYQGPVAKLKCAVNDAEKVAEVFKKQSKDKDLFADVIVNVVTDKDADKAGILKAIDAVKDASEAADMVVIFFAGHGMVDGPPNNKQFYFLGANAVPGNLAKTGVSSTDIKDRLVEVNARRVLFLLDACHSGAIGANGLSRELADDDIGVAVICAAMGKEVARERQGHGLFAKAIIDGLSGKAHNNRGIVYLHHLEQYVIDRVQEDSDDQQHPSRAYPPSVNASSFGLAKP